MYKQKAKGAQGPLMPSVFLVMIGFLLYSVLYTQVNDYQKPLWYYAVGGVLFLGICWCVWRYTSVQMEYIWFGGELVIHRVDNVDRYRMIIRRENLLGLRGDGQTLGQHFYGGHTLNACATLRGRVLECCTLYCRDKDGLVCRIYFQPTKELIHELTDVIAKNQKKNMYSSV